MAQMQPNSRPELRALKGTCRGISHTFSRAAGMSADDWEQLLPIGEDESVEPEVMSIGSPTLVSLFPALAQMENSQGEETIRRRFASGPVQRPPNDQGLQLFMAFVERCCGVGDLSVVKWCRHPLLTFRNIARVRVTGLSVSIGAQIVSQP